jgi:putative endonuclease
MFWKRFLGIFGEDTACEFLKKQGYRIIERNYKCKLGELDIIAKEKGVISFVEVKTLTAGKMETPLDTINLKKQRHIQQSALYYLNKEKMQNVDCRFDVVAIKYKEGAEPDIELIRDAF